MNYDNTNDSYLVNLCGDNVVDDNVVDEDESELELESEEQKQFKRAIKESKQLYYEAESRTTTTTMTTRVALTTEEEEEEEEEFVLARALQLSQIEQQEKERERERKELVELDRSIQESHKSHYEAIQNQLSIQVAQQLQQQIIEPEDIAQAIHESYQSNEKRKLNTAMNHQYTTYKVARSEEKQNGCWDCPRCTFVQISPYESNCSQCKMEAPANQICFKPIPTNLKFGLEIEIIVTDGKKDGYTLELIAERLTSLGPEIVTYMGYTHCTTPGIWKIMPDSSVVGRRRSCGQSSGSGDANTNTNTNACYDDDDICFELVSPPLQNEDGLSQLRSIMNNVRRLGIATNASCGFHVHVDATEGTTILGTLSSIKRISQRFVSLENAFDLLVVKQQQQQQQHHTSNRRTNCNKYCGSNRLAGFGRLSNRQRWCRLSEATTNQQIVQMMNGNNNNCHNSGGGGSGGGLTSIDNLDRNRKLNLTNIVKPERESTYEFRHYGGVEDLFDSECWVRLILLFCYNTATAATATATDDLGTGTSSLNGEQHYQQYYDRCILHERATAKDELRVLFDIVNCPGLEQVFTIDRKLFLSSQQVKNDHWSCYTCDKVFDSSRSLSQHCITLQHQQQQGYHSDNNQNMSKTKR